MKENDYSELEKQLKAEAKKITLKPFEERKQFIFLDNVRQEEVKEQVMQPATINGNIVNNKKYLPYAGLFAILVIFALVLVIVYFINRPSEVHYFEYNNLFKVPVTGEEFYDGLKSAGINVVDVSDYEIEIYALWYGEDIVKGGRIEAYYKDSYFITLDFYDNTVKNISVAFADGHKTYNSENCEVKYYTNETDGVYETQAMTSYKEMTYVIQYVSIEDGFIDFINSKFV